MDTLEKRRKITFIQFNSEQHPTKIAATGNPVHDTLDNIESTTIDICIKCIWIDS